MKSIFEADSNIYFEASNNYRKLHSYAMCRRGGKRKKMSVRERISLPFPESYWLRKGRRVRKNNGKEG